MTATTNEPFEAVISPAVVKMSPSPQAGGRDLRDPIDLVWSSLTVKAGETELLHRVSGHINRGLIAIMGPSGSGKTTLLNCLACQARGLEVEGELRINGEHYTLSTLKKYLGYVQQDDEHNPLLTVRETLRLVAAARLGSQSRAAQHQMVEDLLQQLTLVHCADVQVGTRNSGIAAGEKKRLSVAVELLTLPKMLFLDEPTSNLDSLDALQFIQALRRIVDETDCVIVCTIHQPQYKVFSLFDRLILLRSGAIVYDGAVVGVSDYCAKLNKPCPAGVNPADHLMEVISPGLDSSFNSEMCGRQVLLDLYGQDFVQVDVHRGAGVQGSYAREVPPFLLSLKVSYLRAWTLLRRRQSEWVVNFVLTVINAVLVGTVFLRIGDGESSVAKRLPALFFSVVNQATFGAISTVQLFPSERSVILRLRAGGTVSALPYFISLATSEMLWKLPFPVLFSFIVYWIIGFQNTGEHFFRYLLAMMLAFLAGMSVAMLTSTLAQRGSLASMALPLLMEFSRLFSGYFSPPSQQIDGLKWLDYLSYHFYAFSAVAQNEMDGLILHCTPKGNATTCAPIVAANQLVKNGIDLKYGEAIGLQILYLAVCLTMSYFALRFLKN